MKKIAPVLFALAVMLVASMARADSNPLASQTGINLGLSLSSYQYREGDVMSLTGTKFGLELRGTKTLQQLFFVRGDLRYTLGQVDYSGTGSSGGHQDWYLETRGLVGKDWAIRAALVSPYIGLGYRYLANDLRGFTDTGAVGYRRESNYLYLPVGVSYRIKLGEQARLVTELEYDHLISGKQITRLSDVGQGYGDVTNNQSSGNGLKLSVMYEKKNWSLGPYLHHWNIGQSDTAIVYQNGTPVGTAWEPKNDTVEFGIKAGQQF